MRSAVRSWGAAALVVLVATGVAGCTDGVGSGSPATTQASTQASTPAATSPAPAKPALGPAGYGALTLGMTRAEAIATGLTATTKPGDGTCGGPGDGLLAGAPTTDDQATAGRLFFSATTGRLVAIYAFQGVKTPEGIGIGSTYDELMAAYPSWSAIGPEGREGRGVVRLPANNAVYRIVVLNGAVVELSLDSAAQDCYE